LVEHHPDRPERAKKATYMLLDIQGKHPAVTILHCGSDVAAAVEAAGGFVARAPQSAASCAFADQALLRRYLVEAAREEPEPDINLIRVVE
jgi:transketolase